MTLYRTPSVKRVEIINNYNRTTLVTSENHGDDFRGIEVI